MSHKMIKCKARELLSANENHFIFVISFVIAIAMGVLPLIALWIVGDLISEDIFTAIFLGCLLFLLAPLVTGIYRMSGLAYNHKEFGIADIFYAFSSFKNYLRVLLVDVIGLLKLIIPFFVGIICFSVFSAVFSTVKSITPLIVFLSVLVALLVLPWFKRFYAVSYLVCTEEMKITSAIKYSWRYTKRKSIKLARLDVCFLPMSVLSALALMVPFFIYNFPFRLCLYSVICGELKREAENKKTNEIQNAICPEIVSSGVEEINEQHS